MAHPRYLTRLLAVFGLAILMSSCGTPQAAPVGSTKQTTKTHLVLETVAAGLEVPWCMAFAPERSKGVKGAGRIFVTERPGRIRLIENGRLRPAPWATLDVTAVGEAGLLGIALAPDYARSGHVYVVGTYQVGGRLVNRIIRLTERGGTGQDPKIIVDGIPSGERHAGDAIAFGPDGMLYVATGDVRLPGLAQDKKSLAGKILRYRPDGGIPADNPFPGSPVYALGLRNPQGMAWHPATGDLFATEHGPSGFRNEGNRMDHDEMNVIRRGANYGWPIVAGASNDKRFVPPLCDWTPAIAPSGLALHNGDLFVAALRGQQLRRVLLKKAPGSRTVWTVAGQQAMFQGQWGRIRAVASGPDGCLYFTTSNRDQLSSKSLPGDDRVLRLVSKAAAP